MESELIPLAAVLGSFMTAGFITWAISKSRERRAEMQMQVQSKLIERFGTASELVEFLQSPAGREFVSGVKSAPMLHAKERALTSLTRAFILTGIGIAFVALWLVDGGHGNGWSIPGFILTALGIANLLGAIVSLRMMKSADEDGLPPLPRSDSAI